jgi:hypothetical protein
MPPRRRKKMAPAPATFHQKNAASAGTTTMMPPMASLDTVPHNRPTAAPQPPSKLGNSGRPAQKSPMSEPIKAPRQAPIRVPTMGTGSTVPRSPPMRLPTMANAAARVEPAARREPAAPRTNSSTSPSAAKPTALPASSSSPGRILAATTSTRPGPGVAYPRTSETRGTISSGKRSSPRCGCLWSPRRDRFGCAARTDGPPAVVTRVRCSRLLP